MSGSPRSGASTPLSVGMREGAAVEDSPAVSVTGVPRVSVELNELNDEPDAGAAAGRDVADDVEISSGGARRPGLSSAASGGGADSSEAERRARRRLSSERLRQPRAVETVFSPSTYFGAYFDSSTRTSSSKRSCSACYLPRRAQHQLVIAPH